MSSCTERSQCCSVGMQSRPPHAPSAPSLTADNLISFIPVDLFVSLQMTIVRVPGSTHGCLFSSLDFLYDSLSRLLVNLQVKPIFPVRRLSRKRPDPSGSRSFPLKASLRGSLISSASSIVVVRAPLSGRVTRLLVWLCCSLAFLESWNGQ